MWTVSMLKENAKAALKNFYWPAFLVSLIFIHRFKQLGRRLLR